MNSSGHRANILREASWEIGVGYHQGSGAYGRYWTQNFGRRGDVYPIVINREAATTTDRHVALYIYGSGSWAEMRLRNNQESWGAWQPFRSELGWELPRTRGEHTIWVELRSGSRTTTSSDSIHLNVQMPVLGGLPEAITYTYSLPSQQLIPAVQTLTPLNLGSDQSLEWSVSGDAAWLSVAPLSGTTPQSFAVTPEGFATTGPSQHTGALTVTVTAPIGIVGSPYRVNVTLEVVDREVRQLYLPLVAR
jgi:hypothetical protein